MVFLDESGFLLVPPVRRTWAPRGQTPILPCAGQWTKISAISGISVSVTTRKIALYIRFHTGKNIRSQEVIIFLRYLLRHLCKGFVLLWDAGSFHKSGLVKRFLKSHPLIGHHMFPGYSPELNPDEFVWGHLKREVANSVPKDTAQLRGLLRSPVRRLQRSSKLLWSCIHASDIPW